MTLRLCCRLTVKLDGIVRQHQFGITPPIEKSNSAAAVKRIKAKISSATPKKNNLIILSQLRRSRNRPLRYRIATATSMGTNDPTNIRTSKGKATRSNTPLNTKTNHRKQTKKEMSNAGRYDREAGLLVSDGASLITCLCRLTFIQQPPVRLLKPAFRPNRKVPTCSSKPASSIRRPLR